MATAPGRGAQLRVKDAVYKALDRAIAMAGVHRQALPGSAIVETGDSNYKPDALVNGGESTAYNAIAAPNSVIVVKVFSSSIEVTGAGGKFANYFRVPSIAHYLIICLIG